MIGSSVSPDSFPRRVAMVSMHTSPLDVPGVGDAGGLNVYVAEVARRLAERGLQVDMFTRLVDPATPEVVEVGERIRVLHVPAGPVAAVPKEQLPQLVAEFAERMGAYAGDYDLLHSHYWLSGMAALALAKRHR
ncbi:MAG TPA: glycosyltransferase, partial [Propionibacteriaceae bacterium]